MSRYPVYATDGIEIREKGPKQTDPVVETITADDLLALKRLASKPTEAAEGDGFLKQWADYTLRSRSAEPVAATPEPGELDVEAETVRLREAYQAVMDRGPQQYSGLRVGLGQKFVMGFHEYLRDLESRRKPAAVATDSELSDRAEDLAGKLKGIANAAKDFWGMQRDVFSLAGDASQLATDLKAKPAEPSGWPEVVVTAKDVEHIYACTLKSGEGLSDETWNQAMAQAIQEWLDSKPRPKPAVNSNGTPAADVNLREPVAGTPESVELTERQVFDLSLVYNDADTLMSGTVAVNALLREMGLGLHRLYPKPSAEADSGEDEDNPAFEESDAYKLGREIGRQYLSIEKKLDAIAERLDGPKVKAATIDNEETFALVKYVYLRCPESQSAQAFVLSLANLGLMLARIPFSEGDPS